MFVRGLFVAAFCALLPAGAGQAEGGPDPEAVLRLEAALRDVGCRLTPQTAEAVRSQAQISEEDAALALSRLVDEGRAKLIPEGGWRLVGPECLAK